MQKNMKKLKDLMERKYYYNCYSCRRKLEDGQLIYCIECKVVFDGNCVEMHHKKTNHSRYIHLNKSIFNYCLEHKTSLIFRCMNCNKSLCSFCNFTDHDAKGHQLEQIKKFLFNQNDIDKIKNAFETQKKYFEKIKDINNNLIQTLENDIQIKERIINNYLINKFD